MDTAELMANACPRIGAMGSAFYFIPETTGRGKELGLDGFRFYFIGRGGVLGDVEWPVIHSAFGYWNGELVQKMWESAREKMAPRDGGRAYLNCAHELGRRKFGDVAGLGPFCEAAEAVVQAADPAGLALFAGMVGEPLAADLPARAMQLVATMREFRGSAHLLAILAVGPSPRIAHAIKRPEMVKAFGWPEELPAITDAHHQALAAAEALTDKLVTPAYAALDAAGASALVAGLDGLEAALAG